MNSHATPSPASRLHRQGGAAGEPGAVRPAHPVDRHVGARLRACRMLRGMSQERLAEGLGVTFQQVQKYESGANRISASRLYEVARLLDVRVADFFDGLEPAGTGNPLAAALDSRDAARLLRLFSRIESHSLRRGLLAMAEAAAAAGADRHARTGERT